MNPSTMQVINPELLKEMKGTLKFLLNNNGIFFFAATQQHRDVKAHGLSYEDDYRGNAVAGLILPGRVEIRFHRDFTETRIRELWARVLAVPEVAEAGLGTLYYQGRDLSDASHR